MFRDKLVRLPFACLASAALLVNAVSFGCSEDDDSDTNTDTPALEGSDTNTDPPALTGGEFSFFVTSVGSGANGGNLGGLAGADATCQRLATAVNAGNRTWRAYLSTTTANARDRIGTGPWYNKNGLLIAASVDALHDAATVFNGSPNLIVDENGVNAPGPEHDILTGSTAEGRLFATEQGVVLTCSDWTSNAAEFAARVGHSDIPGNPMFSPLWHSAHDSANCTAAGLVMRGGAGRLYCFAAD
jgi:hypothetical protein